MGLNSFRLLVLDESIIESIVNTLIQEIQQHRLGANTDMSLVEQTLKVRENFCNLALTQYIDSGGSRPWKAYLLREEL